jgi:hypothetical protein
VTRVTGLVILGTVLVVVLGLVVSREPDSAPETSTSSENHVSGIAEPTIDEVEEVGELAVFQQVAKAHREAMLRAQAVAPLAVGSQSPTAPGSTQKGEEKRAGITAGLTSRAQAEIAAAHAMTVEEVNEIYRRGEAEGWPR